MFSIDTRSDKPIYEQIIDNIKELSIKKILQKGDKLPSVRELAGVLTVNPNTVSKAYQELERQKIIETVRGKGTYVSEIKNNYVDPERLERTMEKLKDICIELSYMGFDKDKIIETIEDIYKEIEKGE